MREAGLNMSIAVTRYGLRLHYPIEAEPGVAVCWACRKHPSWPCAETLRLTESLDRLTTARGSQ
jgi:hypothetical protein